LAVGLFAGHSLNVDEVLQSVDGGDFAFTALVGASHNGDFVVFSDGDAADLYFPFYIRHGVPSTSAFVLGRQSILIEWLIVHCAFLLVPC